MSKQHCESNTAQVGGGGGGFQCPREDQYLQGSLVLPVDGNVHVPEP